jgi:hypothetical protein
VYFALFAFFAIREGGKTCPAIISYDPLLGCGYTLWNASIKGENEYGFTNQSKRYPSGVQ